MLHVPIELVTWIVTAIAVIFGVLWALVNFYHLYPYVQFFITSAIVGSRRDVYSRLPKSDENDELPSIDVLLPAYREGNVIAQAIESIRTAEYPQERLTINVLVEPTDRDTRDALERLEQTYTEVVVPEHYPGQPNKPRALNYGFEVSDSDLVGIVDAEDIVCPKLFSKVAHALDTEGYDYLQGMLDMVNEADGWRNLVFRGEYAFWFRILVPSFHFVGYPVPLGGTTNFFHRDVLEQVSRTRVDQYGTGWSENDRAWLSSSGLRGSVPWDPRNVTEDFELGILLWKEGYEMTLIDSVTREESPIGTNAWIRQRTRWQKGKLYTFVQYARHPPKGLPAKFHGYFQSFLPHLAPINIVGVVLLTMIANLLQFAVPLAVWVVLTLGLAFLVEMFAFHAAGYWLVSDEPPVRRAIRAISIPLVVPAYWVLLWGAELRALKQLYMNQLHWEKTDHHGRNVTKER